MTLKNTEETHNLSENQFKLRAIMCLGSWDEKPEFKWRTISDNVCRLKPETIDEISRLYVAHGHEIDPDALKRLRADSFVMKRP